MGYPSVLTLLLVVCVSSSLASCPTFPNNTATGVNLFNCDGGTQMQFSKVEFENADGSLNYPLDLKKTVVLVAESTNNGAVYPNAFADLSLHKWSHGWLGCKWLSFPTFGLLNNLDGCRLTACPIVQGHSTFRREVDLGPFASIITLLGGDSTYELVTKLWVHENGHKKIIGCTHSQFKLK